MQQFSVGDIIGYFPFIDTEEPLRHYLIIEVYDAVYLTLQLEKGFTTTWRKENAETLCKKVA